MRVLIVEDETELGEFLVRAIRDATWAPDHVASGQAALEALAVTQYDLVILDLGLPDIDGFEVCRRYRASGGRTPLLVLTARGGLSDRVRGLDAGADDYLSKPFAVEELLARLRALARRPPAAHDVTLRYADVTLDPASGTADRGGRPLQLTAREFALLEYLLRMPDRVLSRGQILEHVWDDNFDPVANAVDVLVGRVRRKLDPEGKAALIHTVRGMGYMFSSKQPSDAA
jgi:two-component system, OmpR family, copper resistance phosphate regulon response regulator CusR